MRQRMMETPRNSGSFAAVFLALILMTAHHFCGKIFMLIRHSKEKNGKYNRRCTRGEKHDRWTYSY
jgi:hypothetical protein